MRSFASKLLKLADSIDQDWDGGAVASSKGPSAELNRIERRLADLAWTANVTYLRRRKRREFLPVHLLGEPAWDMLLDLFIQYAGGAKVSTSSLCIASHAPASTALRHIAALEAAGLVQRSDCESDGRVSFVSLTEAGRLAMGRCLSEF